jgi:hypothetical protein
MDDNYWRLHRNTIFFSILTIFLGIPGVIQEQPDFIIDISKVPINFIRPLSLVVCIYSFVNFVAEWIVRALPEWRASNSRHKDVIEKISNRYSALDKYVGELRGILGPIKHDFESVLSRQDPMFRNYDMAIDELQHLINGERTPLRAEQELKTTIANTKLIQNSVNPPIKDNTKDWHPVEISYNKEVFDLLRGMKDLQSKLDITIFSSIFKRTQSQYSTDLIEEVLGRFDIFLTSIDSHFLEIKKINKFSLIDKSLLSFENFWNFSRVFLLGFIVPALLLLLAIYQYFHPTDWPDLANGLMIRSR